ncbi:anti-anti-sigma factor [Mycobacterium asiaticum]|uniref:STAS domain-containing protein n=1 Tax=Mycobacterium asiaticum TaxID=1790 RepID=UPI0007F02E99|nr:STAS domain-containing protein [Mycobacterium asiaticum]OBK98465.1 anti-anti-sigma factor [Mycobacterium asiaticum]
MPTALTLDNARSKDGRLVLTALGEIDLSNVDAFDEALGTAASEAASTGERLTVDLSEVEYLDSAAINALFNRADHIQLIAHPLLISVLTMSGLNKLVHVEPAQPEDEQAQA